MLLFRLTGWVPATVSCDPQELRRCGYRGVAERRQVPLTLQLVMVRNIAEASDELDQRYSVVEAPTNDDYLT